MEIFRLASSALGAAAAAVIADLDSHASNFYADASGTPSFIRISKGDASAWAEIMNTTTVVAGGRSKLMRSRLRGG